MPPGNRIAAHLTGSCEESSAARLRKRLAGLAAGDPIARPSPLKDPPRSPGP